MREASARKHAIRNREGGGGASSRRDISEILNLQIIVPFLRIRLQQYVPPMAIDLAWLMPIVWLGPFIQFL